MNYEEKEAALKAQRESDQQDFQHGINGTNTGGLFNQAGLRASKGSSNASNSSTRSTTTKSAVSPPKKSSNAGGGIFAVIAFFIVIALLSSEDTGQTESPANAVRNSPSSAAVAASPPAPSTVRNTQQTVARVPEVGATRQAEIEPRESTEILTEIEAPTPPVQQQRRVAVATTTPKPNEAVSSAAPVPTADTRTPGPTEVVAMEIGRFANSNISEDEILLNTFSSILSYRIAMDRPDLVFYALIDTRVSKSNVPAKFLVPPYIDAGIMKLNITDAAVQDFESYNAKVGGIAFTTFFEGQQVQLAFPYEALVEFYSDSIDHVLSFENGIVVRPETN